MRRKGREEKKLQVCQRFLTFVNKVTGRGTTSMARVVKKKR